MSMSSLFGQLKADLEGIEWPKVLTGATASLFAALFDLERSARLASDDLVRLQERQLDRLLAHAANEVPFYADRLKEAGYRGGTPLVTAVWNAIPVLTRSDIQSAGTELHARSLPASHGAVKELTTSGSTSTPVRVITTDYTDFIWRVLNLRDRMWHKIDLGGTLAEVTGALQTEGRPFTELSSWSLPSSSLRSPGGHFKVNPTYDISEQVQTLRNIDPNYIHTRPSQLNLLLRECEKSSVRFDRLRAVFCVSEVVTGPLRRLCREILGVALVDCYSCAELGYLALQCPEADHYHVQSEAVCLEVLRSDGTACLPGETGRVVVTSLHNYAMPLIRYEIGDEAKVGLPCACGRSLPVIAKVLGRTQDYLKMRSGQAVRADLRHYEIAKYPAIIEFQLVQRDLGRLEIRLVARRPLSDEETDRLKALLAPQGSETFEVEVTYCETIERAASGKLRTFLCEVE